MCTAKKVQDITKISKSRSSQTFWNVLDEIKSGLQSYGRSVTNSYSYLKLYKSSTVQIWAEAVSACEACHHSSIHMKQPFLPRRSPSDSRSRWTDSNPSDLLFVRPRGPPAAREDLYCTLPGFDSLLSFLWSVCSYTSLFLGHFEFPTPNPENFEDHLL